MHLHRKAHHVEPVGRQQLEIVQLLEMRIADLATGAMAFPDQAGIAGLGHLAPRVRERRVPAPAVGADQAHAALQHPQRRRLAHAAAGIDVVVLAVLRPGRGVHHHDLQRLQRVADALQLRLHIAGRGDIAIGQMAEVELHRRLEAPFQRHLVDPPRWLAARLQPVVHRREVVIRRIEMRAVVRADVAALHRGVFAVRQLIDPHPHVLGHRRRGHVMVHVFDLRQRVRRIALDPRLQRHRDVDQPARHRASSTYSAGLHQLRRIGADAAGVAGLRMRQAEVVAHRLQARDRRCRIVLRTHHQRTGHAEHRIGIDMLVVAEVERGDQLAIAVAADQEVDVRRPEAVALLRLHHLADRPIHRDRIAERAHRAEMVAAVRIGAEVRAQVHHLGRILRLEVIQAVLAGLPHLHQCIRNRLAVVVGDAAVHHDLRHRRLRHDAGAERQFRRALAIERPEQAALRAEFARLLVVHRVDQRADAQHVGEQDELLAERRAGLADRGEELDAGQPLGRRQPHVAGEGVQMAHRRVHDLLQARVRRVRHLRECGFGDGGFVKVLHGTLLWLDRWSIAHPVGCSRLRRFAAVRQPGPCGRGHERVSQEAETVTTDEHANERIIGADASAKCRSLLAQADLRLSPVIPDASSSTLMEVGPA